jgi:hemerythrin
MLSDYFIHYKLNIQFLDDEHYRLLEFSDEIKRVITDKEKVLSIINVYYDLVVIHFQHEEEFMESIQYPFIRYHREVHSKILLKLTQLKNDENIYSHTQQDLFLVTIRNGLLHHIDNDDRQISIFLGKS